MAAMLRKLLIWIVACASFGLISALLFRAYVAITYYASLPYVGRGADRVGSVCIGLFGSLLLTALIGLIAVRIFPFRIPWKRWRSPVTVNLLACVLVGILGVIAGLKVHAIADEKAAAHDIAADFENFRASQASASEKPCEVKPPAGFQLDSK